MIAKLDRVTTRCTNFIHKYNVDPPQDLTQQRIDAWEERRLQVLTQKRIRLVAETLAQLWRDGAVPGALKYVGSYDQLAELVHLYAQPTDKRDFDLRYLSTQTKQHYSAQAVFDSLCSALAAQDLTFQAELELIRLQAYCLRRVANVPGFFPTPHKVAVEMFALSGATPQGGEIILEAGAGMGDLAEMIAAWCPGNTLHVLERDEDMRRLLALKGFQVVGGDLFNYTGSAQHIIMNPPFENGLDAKFVKFAYDNILEEGGSLVAVVSQSATFRVDGEYAGFRRWVEERGGEFTRLANGAFRGKTTNVHAWLLALSSKPTTGWSTVTCEQLAAPVQVFRKLNGQISEVNAEGWRLRRKEDNLGGNSLWVAYLPNNIVHVSLLAAEVDDPVAKFGQLFKQYQEQQV